MCLQDTWSTGFFTPQPDLDGSKDAELISASQTPNSTRAVFKRKINSCDGEYDQRIKPGVGIALSWARGAVWGRRHDITDRGQAKVVLIEAQPMTGSLQVRSATTTSTGSTIQAQQAAGQDPNAVVWDTRIGNTTIPTAETTYVCRHFAVPSGTTKVHITRYVLAWVDKGVEEAMAPPCGMYALAAGPCFCSHRRGVLPLVAYMHARRALG